MCGINGFFNFSNVNISGGEHLLYSMNRAIEHRGPDDEGIWISKDRTAYFGHQRLSILDLSEKGHQPMLGSSGSAIVYNGEIYNFQSLRAQLSKREFISNTDTEVLLGLYEEVGEKCLDDLNGMFAFAIWDNRKKELFLARDRIGIKPLYYTTLNGIFAFSSEIKSLLELPWVSAELDDDALYHFLTFHKLSPPQTMFQNIHKFHPGHKMVVGKNGIKRYEPYWEISYQENIPGNEAGIASRVLEDLRQSVKARMVSDVPVGAFLSGGVDSSGIVALMSEFSSQPVQTFSIGFEDSPDYDELKYARQISQRFGTDHYEKIVSPGDIVDFLPEIVDIFDEPLADATAIPIYFISQIAKENGVIVILTGDGADELFAGYRNWLPYIRFHSFFRAYSKSPRLFRKSVAEMYGMFNGRSRMYEILVRASENQELFWGGARGFKESVKRSFLSEEYLSRIGDLNSYSLIEYYRGLFASNHNNGEHQSYIDWMCFDGIKDLIPNRYLYRADRLGMANSVELRVPFLDHNFVNSALSIPGRWKAFRGEPKYILKKSLEDILPRETLYRKKQGFCVPLREWAGEIMVDYVESNLDRFCRETGLFNKSGIEDQVRLTRAGKVDYVNTLWSVYFLMSWLKRWIFSY